MAMWEALVLSYYCHYVVLMPVEVAEEVVIVAVGGIMFSAALFIFAKLHAH